MSLTPVSFKKGREHAPRLSKPHVPGKTHERFWTEAEQDVIRRYYPSGGAAACLVHLPGRGRTGVYQQAHKLGLRAEKQSKPRQRIEAPDDIDDRIRAAWPELKGRGAVNGLADRLGVPRWWLSKRAAALGLSMPHSKEPPWTEAELDLMRRAPLHNPELAARMFREHGFHRTATAIVVKAKRMELSRRATHDTLSATQAARVLGIDSKTLTIWCIAGDIEAERRGTKRLPQQGGDVWAIKPGDLRQFVLDNMERIDIRKVDKFAFVDLLVKGGRP